MKCVLLVNSHYWYIPSDPKKGIQGLLKNETISKNIQKIFTMRDIIECMDYVATWVKHLTDAWRMLLDQTHDMVDGLCTTEIINTNVKAVFLQVDNGGDHTYRVST